MNDKRNQEAITQRIGLRVAKSALTLCVVAVVEWLRNSGFGFIRFEVSRFTILFLFNDGVRIDLGGCKHEGLSMPQILKLSTSRYPTSGHITAGNQPQENEDKLHKVNFYDVGQEGLW